MIDAYEPTDRRKSPRIHIQIDGAVQCSRTLTSLSCVVRDISESGARLVVDSSQHVPDAFQLQLEHEGFSTECIVVWRSGTEIGVEFRNELHAV